MIRFWFRELMGWILVIIGLGIFYLCLVLLLNPGPEFILEGPVFTMIGIFVFRGGEHHIGAPQGANGFKLSSVPHQGPASEGINLKPPKGG